jgi:hypothetical protein
MKKKFFILFFALFITQLSESQVNRDRKFYIGIGTSLSSYLGADFGSTFSIRYSRARDYNNYWYNNYYYNRDNRYDYYYDESLFPLQGDLALGYDATDKVSFQIESSIIWHLNGNARKFYESGNNGYDDYLDRNDNAELISIPIIASVKYYPFGRKYSPFYLTGGYGMQYMQESVDRVREYYNYNSYYNEYRNSSEYTIASYRARDWFHGIKLGLGFNYKLGQMLSGEAEIKFTNFFPANRDNNSNLSMYRSPNITNIALGTKIYLSL